MKKYIAGLLLLIGLSGMAQACDLGAGIGIVARDSNARSVHVECLFRDKVDVSFDYFTDYILFDGLIKVGDTPILSISRRWTYRENKFFRPYVGLGLAFKEAETCPNASNTTVILQDKNCHRALPLPVNFRLSAGLNFGTFAIQLSHFSNAGFAEVNLGMDTLQLIYKFE